MTRRSCGVTAALQCSALKWTHAGFSGGHCTFTTRDYTATPLKDGEKRVIRDFYPFAFTPPQQPLSGSHLEPTHAL
ncbi:hypothetical protein ACIREO_23815 [Streptomyces sp. NPDC102441]|uniref:hypothetical protein n=1 Tax=Streptomyces sp. NPDC102441 TaxID=3366176 RepID=UPI0038090867